MVNEIETVLILSYVTTILGFITFFVRLYYQRQDREYQTERLEFERQKRDWRQTHPKETHRELCKHCSDVTCLREQSRYDECVRNVFKTT